MHNETQTHADESDGRSGVLVGFESKANEQVEVIATILLSPKPTTKSYLPVFLLYTVAATISNLFSETEWQMLAATPHHDESLEPPVFCNGPLRVDPRLHFMPSLQKRRMAPVVSTPTSFLWCSKKKSNPIAVAGREGGLLENNRDRTTFDRLHHTVATWGVT